MTLTSLYKYGRLGKHSEQLFSTPTVWFSKPANLNDPFECRPWLTFNGTREEVIKTLTRVIKKNKPEPDEDKAKAIAMEWYRDGRHEHPELLAHLRESARWLLAEKIGLYCLSEYSDRILMWSHYADDHRGFCMQFEATDSTPFFGEAQQVLYCEDYPTVDFYKTPRDEQVDLIFLTRFDGWRYEAEWRLIDHQQGHGSREYPTELLTRVIFGIRMKEDERALIRGWLARRGRAVKLAETVLDEREFRLTVRDID